MESAGVLWMREVARREADSPEMVTDETWVRAWMSGRSRGQPARRRSNKWHVLDVAFVTVEAQSRGDGGWEEEGQVASEVKVEGECRHRQVATAGNNAIEQEGKNQPAASCSQALL